MAGKKMLSQFWWGNVTDLVGIIILKWIL